MKWSMAAQLRLGFAVALLLVLGSSAGAWRLALDSRDHMTHILTTTQLAEAESAFWQLRYAVPRFMIGSAEEQQRILGEQDKWYAIVEEQLADYGETAHNSEERRALTRLQAAYHRYKQARPKFFELWAAGEKEAAIAWGASTTTPFGADAVRALDAQIALQRAVAGHGHTEVNEHTRTTLGLVTAITIALMGMLVIGYANSVRMLRPILALRERAQQLVREQLGETVDASTGSNEILALEKSFQLMSDRLLVRTQSLAKALEAATSADRIKSEFMDNVTHELRTPLNSVIGFAELLKDEVPGPLNAKQAAFAADILASGQRLLALVEGILEMSRLDAAVAALEGEPVEIGAVLEERVAAHREAAETRGIAVQLDVAPDAGNAELDPRALRRTLNALLDNAIKFNRDNGTVAVRARRDDGWLKIAVADTGIGIAREDLPRLFHPLVQLDAGLARKYGGIGLGLALARRLAELQGGALEVESEPGKGSTFTLRLPIREKS